MKPLRLACIRGFPKAAIGAGSSTLEWVEATLRRLSVARLFGHSPATDPPRRGQLEETLTSARSPPFSFVLSSFGVLHTPRATGKRCRDASRIAMHTPVTIQYARAKSDLQNGLENADSVREAVFLGGIRAGSLYETGSNTQNAVNRR